MCGIVGYTGPSRGEPDPGRGPAPAGVSRVRQRGHRHARPRRGWSSASGRGGSGCWRRRSSVEPAHGHVRDQPHALGDARPGHRPQRPPAPGRPPALDVAVVHNGVIENHAPLRRELEAAGLPLQQPDRHRGHRPPDRARARRRRRPVRGGAARACPGWRGPTAWRSSARGVPARSSAPARQPAGRRRRRRRAPPRQRPGGDRARTPRGSPTSRTARSSA